MSPISDIAALRSIQFCVGAASVFALDLQLVLCGSCMESSFDRAILIHQWQPVQVNSAVDLLRWEAWSFRRTILTICWQLGSLESNLVVFEFLDLQSTLSLRAVCFGWAVELCDNLEEHQVLCLARARGISTSTYYSTLVADPPVQV